MGIVGVELLMGRVALLREFRKETPLPAALLLPEKFNLQFFLPVQLLEVLHFHPQHLDFPLLLLASLQVLAPEVLALNQLVF